MGLDGKQVAATAVGFFWTLVNIDLAARNENNSRFDFCAPTAMTPMVVENGDVEDDFLIGLWTTKDADRPNAISHWLDAVLQARYPHPADYPRSSKTYEVRFDTTRRFAIRRSGPWEDDTFEENGSFMDFNVQEVRGVQGGCAAPLLPPKTEV